MELLNVLLQFLDNDPRVSLEPGAYLSFIGPSFYIKADAFGQHRKLTVSFNGKKVFVAQGNNIAKYDRGEWESEIRDSSIAGEFFEMHEKRLSQTAQDIERKTRIMLEQQVHEQESNDSGAEEVPNEPVEDGEGEEENSVFGNFKSSGDGENQ